MSAFDIEYWLPVPGGSILVSSCGAARHADGSPVAVRMIPQGYVQFRGKQLHRAILRAFVGECPPGMETCHHNDIKTDNRLCNLRWDTGKANAADAVRNGRHAQARKTHCVRGHEFTPENTRTYVTKDGKIMRQCRACVDQRRREVLTPW
jgi:hypothetical protein